MHRHRQTGTKTQANRYKDTDTDRQTQRHRHKDTDTGRQAQRHRHVQARTGRHKDTDTGRQAQRHKDTHRYGHRQVGTQTHIDTEIPIILFLPRQLISLSIIRTAQSDYSLPYRRRTELFLFHSCLSGSGCAQPSTHLAPAALTSGLNWPRTETVRITSHKCRC
jgi:hypothetical protein